MSWFVDLAPYVGWAALAVNGAIIAVDIRRARRERRERSLRALMQHARDAEVTSTADYVLPPGARMQAELDRLRADPRTAEGYRRAHGSEPPEDLGYAP